ncbi:hypothetical protein NM688_g2511 [Phlebia brevispora]|uniref:Uncharacterized protein n=1 Tax=Phlebia brevispora TaxID=194682 RepID=A0ACC1T927_9APHY|nr:hypothetical protein NM688_g2511 [Phlebia brevispora]
MLRIHSARVAEALSLFPEGDPCSVVQKYVRLSDTAYARDAAIPAGASRTEISSQIDLAGAVNIPVEHIFPQTLIFLQMSPEPVRLEIYWDWWIWRGYRSDDIDFNDTLADQMDHPAFDESQAFPALKPNYDVFRPLRYSRKQRGWYQVKRWPPTAPISQTLEPDRTFTASGGEVPPELFDDIIELVRDQQKCVDREEKRVLGACALTCRYWADKCQPYIFDRISLRSRHDFMELCDFRKDPYCRIFQYNSAITVAEQRVTSVPWLHLFSMYKYKLSNGLSLEGPLPKGWKSLRSIHQAIPRALPHSFSRGISQLALTDIRFRQLHDLMRLVSELPDLTDVRCERVLWGPVPSTFPWKRLSSNQIVRGAHKLSMSQCSHPWVHSAFFLFPSFIPRSMPFFAHDDLCRMISLAQIIELLTASLSESVGSVKCLNEFTYRNGRYDDESIVLDIRIEDSASVELFLVHIKATPVLEQDDRDQMPESGPVFRTSVIALDIRERNDSWPPFHWAKFDDIVSSLVRLKIIILGFEHKEDMQRYIQDVLDPNMPLANGRNLLRYAIEGSHSRGWLRASPKSEKTELSHSFDLIDAYIN